MRKSATRRLFVLGFGSFAVAGKTAAGSYPLTDEEVANCSEIARCSYFMRYLEERGAVFEACDPKFPGWYQARWSDPAVSDEPIRWAASVDIGDLEHLYARAFRAKVEGLDKF